MHRNTARKKIILKDNFDTKIMIRSVNNILFEELRFWMSFFFLSIINQIRTQKGVIFSK